MKHKYADAIEDRKMTATLDVSEELQGLIQMLEFTVYNDPATALQCRRYAALLRRIVLPKPLEGALGELPTE